MLDNLKIIKSQTEPDSYYYVLKGNVIRYEDFIDYADEYHINLSVHDYLDEEVCLDYFKDEFVEFKIGVVYSVYIK